MLHILLHIALPLGVAIIFYRSRWLWPFAIMLTGMLIDLDHLLADPIYDPARCSVGFHPLHTLLPIAGYTALLFLKKTRLIGIGLCIHIVLDSIDCRLNTGLWFFAPVTSNALTLLS